MGNAITTIFKTLAFDLPDKSSLKRSSIEKPEPPSREDPAIEQARREAVDENRKARGRLDLIGTTGGGTPAGPPQLRRKRLLGA